MLNHVLTYTEKEKLHFVGHSMGSTTFMVTKSSMHPFQYCLDNVCQFKHIMRHTTFMVTQSSVEVIQKPGNLHKIWVPLQVLNSLEPNWGDHIGVAVMLAPVAYIDHTTSPIRSCICQCKNAVSLQFHFYQLKFQADRRVLPVVPVGRRPYGTCGVSSLNLVSQPHGRLRLRGPCTWFVLWFSSCVYQVGNCMHPRFKISLTHLGILGFGDSMREYSLLVLWVRKYTTRAM